MMPNKAFQVAFDGFLDAVDSLIDSVAPIRHS